MKRYAEYAKNWRLIQRVRVVVNRYVKIAAVMNCGVQDVVLSGRNISV